MNLTNADNPTQFQMAPEHLATARFFVYENLKFIGERAFEKASILIGKDINADLVLNHQAVADIHALVEFKNGQAFIQNKNTGNGLRLNGYAVDQSMLNAEDVIQLGPFSIIFRHDGNDAAQTKEPETDTTVDHTVQSVPAQRENRDIAQISDPPQTASDSSDFSVKLINQYPSKQSQQNAVINLAKLLRTEASKVAKIIAKPEHVLKDQMDEQTARKLENALKNAGIICLVQSELDTEFNFLDDMNLNLEEEPGSPPFETETMHADQEQPVCDIPAPCPPQKITAPAAESVSEHKAVQETINEKDTHSYTNDNDTPVYSPEEEDVHDDVYIDLATLTVIEDEDDDEPWDVDFCLKEKLDGPGLHVGPAGELPVQLQIVKSIGERLVDTIFLDKGQKYHIDTENGRFCIAENKSEENTFAYFTSQFNGFISTDGATPAQLSTYRNETNLYKRRSDLYRLALDKNQVADIYEGCTRYRLSVANVLPSPAVGIRPPEKTLNWRHWAYSAAVHFLVIMCCSVYFYMIGASNQEKKTRFVKVDMSTLKAMEAKKESTPPPKKIEPPKPEPQRVAEKVTPPEKQVAQKTPPKKHVPKSSKRSKSSKKTARAGQTSRHPNAGGGFGEGNISNRNINQSGILSILGKNAVAGPSEAIASVTNIDAVKVPGASAKNFTVGGIKGSLGSGKITMGTSGGGIVTTKGSKQVLRSAGASGPGQVAALERGSVGKGSVRGLVTAKMTRTVKIQGGMSREMVKRVIDQHMSEISYCYESALSSNPSISGRVIFEWKILMNGRVGEIRIVASSINSHAVHDCIKSAIKSWQFPKPSGSEVVVSFPFVFDLVAF